MTWQDPNGESDWRDAYGDYGQEPRDELPDYGPQPAYGQEPPPTHQSYPQPPFTDPYAQTSFGGQDPYGQYNYAAYGPAGGVRTGGNGLTVAALIANIVSAVFCCGIGLTWIPGVILSAMALSRTSSDPDSARKLTVAAWACFVVDVVLTVIVLVLLGLFTGGHHSSGYDGY